MKSNISFRSQAKLITDPYPYFSTKCGLSVDPPNKDTRSGQEETYITEQSNCQHKGL